MSLFITGTDTAVGKTHVSAALVRALRAAGTDAVGFKPVCCGDRDDALALHAASAEIIPLNDVNPVWLRPPVAPYVAAMMEGREVDLGLIRETHERLRARHCVVIEGAGGWLVPLTRGMSMADLAAEFACPIVVVAANRLGVLNHTLLTVEAIAKHGLTCAGVILNDSTTPGDDPAALTNPAILEELLGPIPLLAHLPHGGQHIPPRVLAAAQGVSP